MFGSIAAKELKLVVNISSCRSVGGLIRAQILSVRYRILITIQTDQEKRITEHVRRTFICREQCKVWLTCTLVAAATYLISPLVWYYLRIVYVFELIEDFDWFRNWSVLLWTISRKYVLCVWLLQKKLLLIGRDTGGLESPPLFCWVYTHHSKAVYDIESIV